MALAAASATLEWRSNSLVPKSLLLWPALLIVFGVLNFPASKFLSGILILCAVQALLVNVRRLSPWPSGLLWLGLVPASLEYQLSPGLLPNLMGWVWFSLGISKVIRERSTSLAAGVPAWITLLYVQAVLLAAYR